ncbi:hypothetical protein BWI96_16420 [Siphonobacter sp. SORGH_AS_0500]|uniref:hypothetical protein n=1 Tax=Siphonobacter sp. SORGH_AS_0500 TaxID=1864824 RepID=UPI000CB3FDA9|nr:hypothetical protein [Siphonobacter sp. SORGH_AS_0500]PKK35490.1 hypothetical protein BWI96_16420 [Siphonobacter sp. SORGH_AS_0500]
MITPKHAILHVETRLYPLYAVVGETLATAGKARRDEVTSLPNDFSRSCSALPSEEIDEWASRIEKWLDLVNHLAYLYCLWETRPEAYS